MKHESVRRALIAGAFALAASAPASAVEFYFVAYGGFTDPAEGLVPETPGAAFPDPEYLVPNLFDTDVSQFQHFGWGTAQGDEHSHLTANEISPPGDSEDATNFYESIRVGVTPTPGPGAISPIAVGDPVGEVVGWLDHHNFPIDEIFGPENVAFHYHVDIYPTEADADAGTNAVFESGPLDFTIGVWETRNSAPCPPDGGATGPDGSECDDRFQIALGWEASDLGDVFDELIGEFVFDSRTFAVYLTGLWDDGTLAESFWSPEEGISRMFLRADIQIVPAPGPLVLIAAGLLLLARRARRMRV